jgi:DNA polymerase III subunit gamma/tau
LAPVADVASEPRESIAPVAMDSEQTLDADARHHGGDASATVSEFRLEPEPEPDRVEPGQAVVHQSVSAGVEIDTSVQSGEPDDEDVDDALASVVAHRFVPEAWVTDVKVLGLHGMTGSLIMQSVLLDIDASMVRLAMRESTSRLMNDTHRKRIAEAFAVHLGQVPEIQIETRDSLTETPEAHLARMRQEALKRAQERFQEDPFVAMLTEELGAEVRIETIQPRENDHV